MADVVIPYRFRVKRDTAAAFTTANTLLLSGEIGLETDTRRYKIGDGTTPWGSLAYSSAATIADTRRILDLLGSTAEGDIIYKGPSGWTRLPKGTDGEIIKQVSGFPAWSAGGGSGSGSFQFVSSVEVSGSAASSMGVSGLNLGVDGAYMIVCAVNNALGSFQNVRMFYNADTTNTNYYRQAASFVHSAAAYARANDANIMECDASADVMTTIWISKDGDGRARAVAQSSRAAPASIILQIYAHAWNTTTNVTSIDLTSSSASALGVGSYMRVYKVLPS